VAKQFHEGVDVLTTATINRLRELYPQGHFEVRRFRLNIVVRPENDDAEFAADPGHGTVNLTGVQPNRGVRIG
jgi:uncharacterized protein YcbX